MTRAAGDEHRSDARDLRADGHLAEAGDRYTLAAYEYLGDTTFETPHTATARGLCALLKGATCDRIAATDGRPVYRCLQGVLIASDMVDRDLDYRPESRFDAARRGVWFEFVGDFRTVGAMEGVDDAYHGAELLYSGGDDPDVRDQGNEHEWLYDFFTTVVGAVPDVTAAIDATMTFSERVSYKYDRLPGALDHLTDAGEWPVSPGAPPRATRR